MRKFILDFFDQFFDERYRQAKVSTRIILRIMSADTFTEMTIQDKVTSLATLMLGFQKDFGFMPEKLCYRLARLNQKLILEINEEKLDRK